MEDYLRIVKVGNLYDWVDEDNKNIEAETVGYLNKYGIANMKRLDACSSPITFKNFIENECIIGAELCKDLYALCWHYGSLDYTPHKEWYHSIEDLKERYEFMKQRGYLVYVYDLNANKIAV